MTLLLRRVPVGMTAEEASSMLTHIHRAKFSYETNYT